MGQTLTHGIYLPDEGERNCYNGLAANWNILDGAVGTVAEHTTQIAGKAPAVHTHTKSDVTDLFNSANTWSNTNTYTVTGDVPIKITNNKDATNPSATEMKDIRFLDINGKIIGGVRHSLESGGTSKIHLYSRSFSLDGSSNSNHGLLIINNKQTGIREVQSESNLIPSANNSYDLGSSSYQWNNLYAKNYYYNGTAWGLDKLNRWSKNQELRLAELEDYTLPSSEVTTELLGWWGTTNFRGGFSHQYYTNGDEGCRFLLSSKDANNNAHLTAFRYKLNRAGTDSYFYGTGAQNFHLGTSTNKWKTLNGVNPGALSLPSEDASSTNLDPTNWNTTGTQYNAYTPPSNGWLGIQVMSADTTDLTGQYIFAGRNTGGQDFWPQGQLVNLVGDFESNKLTGNIFFPVIANKQYQIRIKIGKTQTEGSIIRARFYPCLGNV